MKEEHWRIIIADTECPYRENSDELNACFCKRRTDPEDNPYCSFMNCRNREI